VIRVEGLAELRRASRGAKREVRRAGEAEVLLASQNVRAAARARVRVKSGATRDSIQLDVRGLRGGVKVTDFKGHWIELGTVRAPAYPYLFNSWEEERPRFQRRLAAATAAALARGIAG
jgi:hypothetical protein